MFATYMSLVTFATIFATAQYDVAIILAKTKSSASNLIGIIFCNSAFVSAIFLIVILIVMVTHPGGNSFLTESLALTLTMPLAVFLAANYQSLNSWANREKYYRSLAGNRVLQSGAAGIVSIFLAPIMGVYGLIFGQIGGQALSLKLLLSYVVKTDSCIFKSITRKRMIFTARKYSIFPRVNIFLALVNYTYNNGKFLIFTLAFSPTTIGQLYLVYRILGLPASVIGSALSEVLLKEIAEKINNKKVGATHLILRSFFSLFLVAAIPVCILYIYGAEIFRFVFGEAWSGAGTFASILAVGLLFEFSISPLSKLLFVINSNKVFLYWEIFRAFVIYAPILLIASYGNNIGDVGTIWMISLSTTASYLVLLFMVLLLFWRSERGGSN